MIITEDLRTCWLSINLAEDIEEWRRRLRSATQGSHSHGKSGKVMEKFVVMESHGKVTEIKKDVKSHGKMKILP